jgi:hypothetical protein
MADLQDRVPKGGKNVARGNRHRNHTKAMRPVRITRSRKRHLKNAKRSCGVYFAEQLAKEYARNSNPGHKAGNK